MMLVACLGRTPLLGLVFLPLSEPTPAAAATPQASSSSSLCIDDGEPATVISNTIVPVNLRPLYNPAFIQQFKSLINECR